MSWIVTAAAVIIVGWFTINFILPAAIVMLAVFIDWCSK
jgi:hypothetical protein